MIEVVAAAIIRDGCVLAARRRAPEAGWEFPGGKVEDGEDDAAALRREIDEELQVGIEVGTALGESDEGGLRLTLYRATTTEEPTIGSDHDELRWLTAGELGSIDWLPLDRVLLPSVLEQLG